MVKGPTVSLITKTENPELAVYKAALNCTSSLPIASLQASDTASRDALIQRVLASRHMSILEHASFTFGIEGVSRALSHQLVRHRHASFGQCSQRYTCFGNKEFRVPPSVAGKKEALQVFLECMDAIQQGYDVLCSLGVPQEDARYLLPNAAQTKLVMTMNARELRHFFNLRCCTRAQWEIRSLANAMLQICQAEAPALFTYAGAFCREFGTCPEGSRSCGLYQGMPQVSSVKSEENTQQYLNTKGNENESVQKERKGRASSPCLEGTPFAQGSAL
ncbi:MAG: FAD-dependent thymidylate synthase [Candidatus Cloacimonetes bacterium]|nr:FAD-dependent thymidylate synthase [Candidatus Cloacimonadota bacterium]MDY0171640.1 FAD-dependent thymidylate synthase [Candidatus Cloacimonadaceae bacterium]